MFLLLLFGGEDCNGVKDGTAYLDDCNICVGGTTGETACIQDCNNEWGGTAYTDNCSACVGGNTGKIACTQDCNNEWGGTAYTDNCSACVGGNTGKIACIQDCNDEWGGTASLDLCGICAGGNTGNSPCYEEVTSGDSRIWLDRNLGASQVATSMGDTAAYGDYYQWGRLADGHENSQSETVTGLSSGNEPGHNDFITPTADPFDWRGSINNDLWQGVAGTNNPCPAGFRLPTDTEFITEYGTWTNGTPNSLNAFNSLLKLVVAGYRNYDTGLVVEDGAPTGSGHYYTSTIHASNDPRFFFVGVSGGGIGVWYRANGRSVRCIKD